MERNTDKETEKYLKEDRKHAKKLADSLVRNKIFLKTFFMFIED